MTSNTSQTLLERLRDGLDPLAWEEFADRYWRLIFAMAKVRGCSDHTAEEIVQEVMLAVFNEGQVFET
jgi:DNA-directed RNA polymerase specialized sigma24 family protein